MIMSRQDVKLSVLAIAVTRQGVKVLLIAFRQNVKLKLCYYNVQARCYILTVLSPDKV